MGVEEQRDRPPDLVEVELVERSLAVARREAGRHQEVVAIAEWHVERRGEVDDHLAARIRSTGLEEAEVALGDAGFGPEGRVENGVVGRAIATAR